MGKIRMNWNMTTTEICDHIINLDEHQLSLEHITQLRMAVPNVKETEAFKKSVGQLSEGDVMGKSALFWQELIVTVDPYIRDRLDLWDFKLSFKELLREEQSKTDLLMECITKIKSDDYFKRVLAIALDIGNYVNGGKRQGKAYGFSISTLEKVT